LKKEHSGCGRGAIWTFQVRLVVAVEGAPWVREGGYMDFSGTISITHTAPTLSAYCTYTHTHTLLYAYCTHTHALLLLYSYCSPTVHTHTLLLRYSYSTSTVLRLASQAKAGGAKVHTGEGTNAGQGTHCCYIGQGTHC
jgi:hypothetical protein